MVKASNNSFNKVLVLTFIFILSTPSLGRVLTSTNATPQAIPTCKTVNNVDTGDTCDNIIKFFDLEVEKFSSLNPNLNCDKLFVGEYVCLNGTLST
ncbi:hypothetical protein H5410_038268 [Solanum commersonii]|uniref:LysM domain-containing protein n=1 Tax=Solanum commersonii TaxID=4109 RepID=A0A9J5YCM9_SOLCO|nr:hypothetical protein H5410_038268 [Solanum commersonii]